MFKNYLEKVKKAIIDSKIIEECRYLIDDLKNKHFTDRVKVFVACISCVVIVGTLIGLMINSAGTNNNMSYEEDGRANEAVSDNESDESATDTGEQSEKDNSEEAPDSSSETESVENEDALAETEDAGEEYIKETLFIGDSNTVRMMNYGLTSLDNTIAVVGMGIQSVKSLKCVQFSGYSEPVTMVEAVKLMQPGRIIITFGTNNANGMETDDFIKKYKEALEAISEASPGVDILINSVPPICEKNSYPKLSQNSIDKFNNALIVMAKELGYKFIDSASVMKDEKTGYAKQGFTVNDGIHISEDGFAAMFTYIRTHSHVVKDTSPKPVTALPKQVKATYVIDSSGKLNNDPDAYKEMSEVSKAQQEALKKALEESAKKAQEEQSAKEILSTSSSSHTHSYSWTTVREATESREGLKRKICSCGDVIDEETIAKKASSKPAPSPSSSSSQTTSSSSSSSSSSNASNNDSSSASVETPPVENTGGEVENQNPSSSENQNTSAPNETGGTEETSSGETSQGSSDDGNTEEPESEAKSEPESNDGDGSDDE